MDLNKISSLKIIKAAPDPLAKINGTSPGINTIESQSEKIQTQEPLISRINKSYSDVRQGKLSENDFERKLSQLDNNLIKEIDPKIKKDIKKLLNETLKWYFSIKLLISTGYTLETLMESDPITKTGNNSKYDLSNHIKALSHLEEDQNDINPKGNSFIIKEFLSELINDDIINPKYKIDTEMLMYLSNQRPTFLNEITVLFDLYSKYYDQISNDLLEDLPLRKIDEIQPRFNMINRHILSSNLSTRIDYDIDLTKVPGGDIPTSISTSQLGLQKRMNNLNSWLTNGIIHTQSSINRFSALKPVTKKTYLGLNNLNNQPVITKYQLWMVLRDTKAFLESLKGLVDGTAFITGMQSGDILDVLEVNY